MRLTLIGIGSTLLIGLVACGETVQTVDSGKVRKSDSRAWEIKDNGYLAGGWTPGNEASWDAQLKKRAQAQNDFAGAAP